MARDRDRANPVAAHAKAQKQASIKKNKAAVNAQRSERLASRNPDRLQRQIDDMKAMQEAQGGDLRPRDREMLQQWEREVKAIRKAREEKGIVDSRDSRGGRGEGGALGKRRREDDAGRDGGDARGQRERDWRPRNDRHHDDRHHQNRNRSRSPPTDDDVRVIPMPRDTPPPIPRRQFSKPAAAAAPAQTTYSSAPQIRDLQKEATAKFVPAAVAAKMKAMRGETGGGAYLEPEEVERLERAGYLGGGGGGGGGGAGQLAGGGEAVIEDLRRGEGAGYADADGDDGGDEDVDLDEEERAFQRELAAESLREDVEKVADEAEKEAEFEIMADAGGEGEAQKAERHLRHVEMEEVEDEEG